jgi:hypothetical protein
LPRDRLIVNAVIKGQSNSAGYRRADDLYSGYNLEFTSLTDKDTTFMKSILYHLDKKEPATPVS